MLFVVLVHSCNLMLTHSLRIYRFLRFWWISLLKFMRSWVKSNWVLDSGHILSHQVGLNFSEHWMFTNLHIPQHSLNPIKTALQNMWEVVKYTEERTARDTLLPKTKTHFVNTEGYSVASHVSRRSVVWIKFAQFWKKLHNDKRHKII